MDTRIITKNKIKNLIFVFCILIFSNLASSQIIGGEVFSSKNIDPSWQNVFVYDVDNPSNYREVQVSPDQYRYAFANTKINTDKHNKVLFPQNANLRAEILDFKNGFMAGPVEMNLASDNSKYYSCTDCDIFGRMEFRGIVQLNEPSKKLYISNNPKFNLKVNIYDDCDSYIKTKNSFKKFCEKGCDYNEYVQGFYGKNNIELITDCFIGKRLKDSSRKMDLSDSNEKVSYQKTILKSEDYILVNFYGTKTNKIFSVVDFTPDEYEIFDISNNGIAYDEDGYFAIEWKNLNNDTFNFTYKIKPKEEFYSCELGLENITIIKKSLSKRLEELNLTNIKDKQFYSNCNFSKEISVQIIKEINLEKIISPSLKKDKSSVVNLQGNLSSPVENLELKEYIPTSFSVSEISAKGVLKETPEYKIIVWNFSGDKINLEYKLTPSKSGNFNLITKLDEIKINEKSVSVSNSDSKPVEPINDSTNITKPDPIEKRRRELKKIFDFLLMLQKSKNPLFEKFFRLLLSNFFN